jgi:hypothetical protein
MADNVVAVVQAADILGYSELVASLGDRLACMSSPSGSSVTQAIAGLPSPPAATIIAKKKGLRSS